jgi:hypothetical protein
MGVNNFSSAAFCEHYACRGNNRQIFRTVCSATRHSPRHVEKLKVVIIPESAKGGKSGRRRCCILHLQRASECRRHRAARDNDARSGYL